VSAELRAASAADYEQVVGLLRLADLPTAGLQRSLPDFLVAQDDGRVVAAIGLEVYGHAGLLRSAVVEPSRRGTGLGRDLVSRLLEHAHRRGVREVYLLTTTAERYFPRFGFIRVDREAVAPAVRASEEFRGACPDSAVAMRKTLEDV
jgi:amino-acid N-acetyltransferase